MNKSKIGSKVKFASKENTPASSVTHGQPSKSTKKLNSKVPEIIVADTVDGGASPKSLSLADSDDEQSNSQQCSVDELPVLPGDKSIRTTKQGSFSMKL